MSAPRVPGMTEWVCEVDGRALLSRDSHVTLACSNAARFLEDIDPGAIQMRILGKVTPEQPCPRHTVK